MRYISLLLLLVLQSCLSKAQVFEGSWKGVIQIQGQELPLIFTVVKSNEQLKGYMESPLQSKEKILFTSTTSRGDSIFITVKNIGLFFKGKLQNDVITGVFRQGGLQTQLSLHPLQGELVAERLIRDQEVKAPYSYDIIEVMIPNEYDKIELGGTLSMPKGKGKYPAVILVSGSGPQNRNSEVFGHEPFKVLADRLTKAGIIVLRYDDRGVGKSGGVFEASTIENFSKDAIAAFNFLKKQPNIDRNKLGIIGHSEGGLIAQLLAGQALPNLSFVVSLAGPSFSMDKMMVEQLYAIGKASGMSEENLAKARKINEVNFEIVKSKANTAEAYESLLINMSGAIGNSPTESAKRELMTMLAPAYRYFMRIEPEKYIPKIYIPIFAAFGSLDVQVPADANLKSLFTLLPKNTKSVLKEYEGLNHLFQPAKTGLVKEYATIPITMSEQVMKDVGNWIIGL